MFITPADKMPARYADSLLRAWRECLERDPKMTVMQFDMRSLFELLSGVRVGIDPVIVQQKVAAGLEEEYMAEILPEYLHAHEALDALMLAVNIELAELHNQQGYGYVLRIAPLHEVTWVAFDVGTARVVDAYL